MKRCKIIPFYVVQLQDLYYCSSLLCFHYFLFFGGVEGVGVVWFGLVPEAQFLA